MRGKVIVLGPAEAGKSTLIQALTRSPVNLAVHGRTVAMDHGMLIRDDVALSVVGVPGQARFAVVRESLLEGACVAVWVHPAGASNDPVTADIVRDLAAAGIPYVVFVNDHRGACSTATWTTTNSLPPPIQVIHGDALRSQKSVERVELAIFAAVRSRLQPEQIGG